LQVAASLVLLREVGLHLVELEQNLIASSASLFLHAASSSAPEWSGAGGTSAAAAAADPSALVGASLSSLAIVGWHASPLAGAAPPYDLRGQVCQFSFFE